MITKPLSDPYRYSRTLARGLTEMKSSDEYQHIGNAFSERGALRKSQGVRLDAELFADGDEAAALSLLVLNIRGIIDESKATRHHPL